MKLRFVVWGPNTLYVVVQWPGYLDAGTCGIQNLFTDIYMRVARVLLHQLAMSVFTINLTTRSNNMLITYLLVKYRNTMLEMQA